MRSAGMAGSGSRGTTARSLPLHEIPGSQGGRPLRAMPKPLQIAVRTDAGCVRANNEDNFGFDPETGVFVVCDGMGGHASGEVASSLSVDTILAFFREEAHQAVCQRQPATALAEALKLANSRIRNIAGSNPAGAGMGTTAVCVLVRGRRFWTSHVGDSRLYHLSEGSIRQLTQDHTLVAEYVRNGVLAEHEAANSSVRHIITRALGTAETVDPEVSCRQASPGDTLLLTTDGLTMYLGADKIQGIIDSATSLEHACDRLIMAAKQAGGEDNVTCLLIRFPLESHATET